MRKFMLLFFLAAFFRASSQKEVLFDSLSKYSYLLQTKTAGSKMQATGFFARYGPRLFFVTAAHCVTGWDPFLFRRVENFPDTLFIRLSNDTSRLHYLPLPVTDIKKTVEPFREYESPDVYVIEIKNPQKYPVFSIEQYFKERVRCELVKSIWVFGYTYREELNDYLSDRQQPFMCTAQLGEAYCLYSFRPEAKRPDQLNYFTYLKNESAGPGLSGAPAYLLMEDKQIVFGGIYIGGGENSLRSGMVLRPEYVIEKLLLKIQNQ